jgi:hypothetical protein
MTIVEQPIGVIKRAGLIDHDASLIAQLRELEELREQVRRAELLADALSRPMTGQRRSRLCARPTPVSANAKTNCYGRRLPRSG